MKINKIMLFKTYRSGIFTIFLILLLGLLFATGLLFYKSKEFRSLTSQDKKAQITKDIKKGLTMEDINIKINHKVDSVNVKGDASMGRMHFDETKSVFSGSKMRFAGLHKKDKSAIFFDMSANKINGQNKENFKIIAENNIKIKVKDSQIDGQIKADKLLYNTQSIVINNTNIELKNKKNKKTEEIKINGDEINFNIQNYKFTLRNFTINNTEYYVSGKIAKGLVVQNNDEYTVKDLIITGDVKFKSLQHDIVCQKAIYKDNKVYFYEDVVMKADGFTLNIEEFEIDLNEIKGLKETTQI